MEEFVGMIIALLLITILVTILSVIGLIIGLFQNRDIKAIPNKIDPECKECRTKNKKYLTSKIKVENGLSIYIKTMIVIQIAVFFLLLIPIFKGSYSDTEILYVTNPNAITAEMIREVSTIFMYLLTLKINIIILILNTLTDLLFGKKKVTSIITVCDTCGSTEQYYVE